MDTGVMAGRLQMARERIEGAAKVLAGRAGVPEPKWQRNADPEVSALWRLEDVADLLENLVAASSPKQAKARSKKAEAADADPDADGETTPNAEAET